MKRLAAVLCALVLAMGAGIWYVAGSPSEVEVRRAFADAPFYVYPQAEEITDLGVLETIMDARVRAGDNPRILMGSSELAIQEPNSSHPARFFGEHNYGFNTVSVGKAGYQSLWHAIEIGALDQIEAVPDDKAAFIVGMQWFMEDGCTAEAFLNSFSSDAYRELMANPDISQQTKEGIAARARTLGVGSSELDAASSQFVADKIDRAFEGVVLGGERRERALVASHDNTRIPPGRFDAESDPDWAALMELSISEGESSCTTNDVGVFDQYYNEYFVPWLEDADKEQAETFAGWSQKELGDFRLYLQVCKEAGVEPLIIIMPVKAAYYDHTAYNYESRQIYYDMIRSTCDEYGVEYADYSEHEYDTYFMRDVMHFGWTGWAHVDQALYEFFGDDAQ